MNEIKESLHGMNTQTAGYLIFYGAFLILCGLFGYLSNPEKAKTALMSGGTFGALAMVWGILGARGFGWSRLAALITTSLLALVFAWRRASAGWRCLMAAGRNFSRRA
jgi:uncharacterized membrane protein (UPF0136 family)